MERARFEELERSMPADARMKLNKLRDFLRNDKASVMVGAGFSKNARMAEDVRMKDWGELCEDFHFALYGKKPDDSDFRLKSALRLAQQIESTLGRAALDELIQQSLPNDSISPGHLHELLVSLSWRDIFTTNYDTLLEEAALKVYKHYDVVTSKNSLIYKQHPRIVKLHGSFPDNRPFIITEEDYRSYPERFPEFVNTIRQALIETQFCLLGFSGDDPNFLSWLGWFRDIMGKEMLPVYMIYVGDHLHEAELNLLGYRRVVPIVTGDISQSPQEALDFILSYIGDVFKPDWQWNGSIAEEVKSQSLPELTDTMRRIRESYPGWIMLPYDKLNEFDDCRSDFPYMQSKFKSLNDDQKFNFLYEYMWRMRTAIMPFWMDDDWMAELKEACQKPLKSESDDRRRKRESLSGMLLHCYRITDDPEFTALLEDLKSTVPVNDSEMQRHILYEEALYYTGHCMLDKLRSLLNNWNPSPEDYRGTLWKGKILMENGKADEAGQLLEVAISDVRRKLMSNSDSEYLLSALTLLTKCREISEWKFEKNKSLDPRFLFSQYLDVVRKSLDRREKPGVSRTHGFNIGSSGKQWYSGTRGYFESLIGAGRYYELTEAYGMPTGTDCSRTINSNYNKLALPLIASVDFNAALPYLMETNDDNALDLTVSRKATMMLTEDEATEIFDRWFEVLAPFADGDRKPKWDGREINVVLPLLARLCTRVDTSRTEKIIAFIRTVYNPQRSEFTAMLTTCYNCLPADRRREIWWQLMAMPIELDRFERTYPLPRVSIDRWEGDDAVADSIIDGLESDSKPINRIAVWRYGAVRNILPPNLRERFDEVITKNFAALSHTDLINYLGFDFDPQIERPWYGLLLQAIDVKLFNFLDEEFVYSGSSGILSNFEEYIILFIDCRRAMSDNDKNKVVLNILRFLDHNLSAFEKTRDSNEMLGGMKKYMDDVLESISGYLALIDAKIVPTHIRTSIAERLVSLSERYPVMKGLVNMAVNAPDLSEDQARELYEQLRERLDEKVTAHDRDLLIDAFHATSVAARVSKGRFSVQSIVEKALDKVLYFFDGVALNIWRCLPVWIGEGVIKKANMKTLAGILAMYPERVTGAEDIAAEQKCDLLHYAYRVLVKLGEVDHDDFAEGGVLATARQRWEALRESGRMPRDIFK